MSGNSSYDALLLISLNCTSLQYFQNFHNKYILIFLLFNLTLFGSVLMVMIIFLSKFNPEILDI